MLRHASVLRTAVSVCLSAMMALPIPALSKMTNDDSREPVTTEGAPVIFQEVVIDGKTATFVVVPVAQEDEAELTAKLAKNNPSNLTITVAGPDDPVLKAAAATGFLKWIKTFVAGGPEKSPLLNSDILRPSLREKIAAKINAISAKCKESRTGLVSAIIYSGVLGSSVAITSSSVPAGVAAFSAIAMWNSFILLKPATWGKVIKAGGSLGGKIALGIASLSGIELSDIDKRVYELTAKFATTWSANFAQVSMIRYLSGEMQLMNRGMTGFFEDFAVIAFTAVQNNYNIWDDAVLEKYSEKKVSRNFVERYLIAQYVVGGMMEMASYQHVPYTGLTLTVLTLSGVAYLLLNVDQQEKIHSRGRALNFALKSGANLIANAADSRRNFIQRRVGSVMSRVAKTRKVAMSGCEILFLQNKATFFGHRGQATFTQWDDIQ